MRVIDFHTHIEDILYGGDLIEPYKELVRTPGDIFEASSFRIGGLKGPFEKISHHLEAIYIHHRINYGTIANLEKSMEKYKVDVSVLLPIAPLTTAKQYLEKVKDSKKFLLFGSVSPYDMDKEKKIKEQMEIGCLGLKLHPPLQNASPDHPGYFEILEAFKRYNKPVLFHTGVVSYYIVYQTRYLYGEPKRYEKLISAFRDIPIILGHMGLREASQAIELARKYPNLYADSSNQNFKNLKRGLNAFGQDRLLFGSDFPASRQIVPIKIGMKLTENDETFREKFFFKNAQKLLGI